MNASMIIPILFLFAMQLHAYNFNSSEPFITNPTSLYKHRINSKNTNLATKVIYVDNAMPLGGDGRTWGTAYKYLQDALAEAPLMLGGQTTDIQIWVAEGTYYPDEDEGMNVTDDDRNASFICHNNVSIYGGFANGDIFSKRNWIDHPTILSGELGNQNGTTDNSYHVLTIIGVNTNIVISGFEIRAGNANEASGLNSIGAGVILKDSNPNISYCYINDNEAENGAGLYAETSQPIISNAIIAANKASSHGSAMYNTSSEPQLINCTLKGNYKVLNTGSSIYNYSKSGSYNIVITNSILWNSGTEIESVTSNDVPIVSYSIVKGGFAGTNNIDEDPLLTSSNKLMNCSPAINQGDNTAVIGNVDYHFTSRIQFSTVDIGASEFSDDVKVIYVDSSRVFDGNGTSWLDARKYLYSALESIVDCNEENIQIWLAEGTYFPDISNPGSDLRDFYFTMINSVAIYGGFDGTETNLTERNWIDNKSILSGDLDQNGGNVTNAYHVIKNVFTDDDTLSSTAILDGIYITAGNANVTSNFNGVGGGMYNVYASPILNNCTFYNNNAVDGGAIYCSRSKPLISNCAFDGNIAERNGGAINLVTLSNSIISNCIFNGNTAFDPDPGAPGSGGGAIRYGTICFPIIEDCEFTNNSSQEKGGAIDGVGYGLIRRCNFDNNDAENGGAVYLAQGENTIIDCNFNSNISKQLVSISDE